MYRAKKGINRLRHLSEVLKVQTVHSNFSGIEHLKRKMDLIIPISIQISILNCLAKAGLKKSLSVRQRGLLRGILYELSYKIKYMSFVEKEKLYSENQDIDLKKLVSVYESDLKWYHSKRDQMADEWYLWKYYYLWDK